MSNLKVSPVSQQSNYNLEIYKLQNNLHKIHYINELQYLENNKTDEVESRIEYLKNILKEQEILNNKKDDIKLNHNNMFDEIDKYTYRKSWKYLTPFHRFNKIKEYISLQNISDKNKITLLKELEKLIFDNKLIKSVIYNPTTEKIESIPAIIFNDDDSYNIISN